MSGAGKSVHSSCTRFFFRLSTYLLSSGRAHNLTNHTILQQYTTQVYATRGWAGISPCPTRPCPLPPRQNSRVSYNTPFCGTTSPLIDPRPFVYGLPSFVVGVFQGTMCFYNTPFLCNPLSSHRSRAIRSWTPSLLAGIFQGDLYTQHAVFFGTPSPLIDIMPSICSWTLPLLAGGIFQGDVAARKALLHLSESAWADALMELALCERELDDPFAVVTAATAAASASADGTTSGPSKVTKMIFRFFHSLPSLNQDDPLLLSTDVFMLMCTVLQNHPR